MRKCDYDESGQAFLEKRGNSGLATALVTEANETRLEYALLSGHAAMAERDLPPLELGAKEGLALNNGVPFSGALAALAEHDAENIVRHAEIAAALSLEALLGFRDAFLPHIQQVRRHRGQIEVADRIQKILAGSTLVDGDAHIQPRVVPPQDAYSLRVTPQVTGAVWDTLRFIRQTISNELNAATDNPLVFHLPEGHPLYLPRDYRVVSGGNFHGAPLAYAMDFLSIVLTDLGSLCERRIFRLTDPTLSHGLPAMLIEEERNGQTSGMMIAQYLAAGLISDCKTLAHPDSVDSIPTCANQEDHVSMSMNAARHARQVVENVEYVVAIELLCAAIGVAFRLRDLERKKRGKGYKRGEKRPEQKQAEERTRVDEKVLFLREHGVDAHLGSGSQVAYDLIQHALHGLPEFGTKPMAEDRYLRPYVLRIHDLLRRGTLVEQVDHACGMSFHRDSEGIDG
jgi:histidine ammonia-lyase